MGDVREPGSTTYAGRVWVRWTKSYGGPFIQAEPFRTWDGSEVAPLDFLVSVSTRAETFHWPSLVTLPPEEWVKENRHTRTAQTTPILRSAGFEHRAIPTCFRSGWSPFWTLTTYRQALMVSRLWPRSKAQWCFQCYIPPTVREAVRVVDATVLT
jgi:hypothetical protein